MKYLGIMLLFLVGCSGTPKPVAIPSPPVAKFEKGADLMATVIEKSKQVDEAVCQGEMPKKEDTAFVVKAVEVLQPVFGPGEPYVSEFKPLVNEHVELKMYLETMKWVILKEVEERQIALEDIFLTKKQVEENLASQEQNRKHADIEFDLALIGLAGGLATVALFWFSFTRKFAPMAILISAALVALVVFKALLVTILIAVGGIVALYFIALWALAEYKEHMKSKMLAVAVDAIEETGDKSLKDKAAAKAREAGVADALAKTLKTKGYSK